MGKTGSELDCCLGLEVGLEHIDLFKVLEKGLD